MCHEEKEGRKERGGRWTLRISTKEADFLHVRDLHFNFPSLEVTMPLFVLFHIYFYIGWKGG
jgi:hypothetical protein